MSPFAELAYGSLRSGFAWLDLAVDGLPRAPHPLVLGSSEHEELDGFATAPERVYAHIDADDIGHAYAPFPARSKRLPGS